GGHNERASERGSKAMRVGDVERDVLANPIRAADAQEMLHEQRGGDVELLLRGADRVFDEGVAGAQTQPIRRGVLQSVGYAPNAAPAQASDRTIGPEAGAIEPEGAGIIEIADIDGIEQSFE